MRRPLKKFQGIDDLECISSNDMQLIKILLNIEEYG